jgi:VWFA-related protein
MANLEVFVRTQGREGPVVDPRTGSVGEWREVPFPLGVASRITAACVGIGAQTVASAAQTQAVTPPVLEVTTVGRVVDVYATVEDARGRRVTDLGPSQFELREDGVPQRVDYFARETDAPLSLGLLVDTSASQAQLLATEQEEARAFLRTVLGPSDRAFVMRFDQDVVVIQGLTNVAPLLSRAIDALRTDPNLAPAAAEPPRAGKPRGTRLHDAIQQASDLLSGKKGRKVLVLLTDGEDQGSQVTREAALEAAERAEVIVYSVLVADPIFYWGRGREYEGEAALEALQKKTGGFMVRPGTARGLDQIASELRAQYRLGYSPRRADGAFHRIDVRLRGARYTVRARRGYYATAE